MGIVRAQGQLKMGALAALDDDGLTAETGFVELAGDVGGVVGEGAYIAGLARFAQGEFGVGDAGAAGGGADLVAQEGVVGFALAVFGQDQRAFSGDTAPYRSVFAGRYRSGGVGGKDH